MYHIILIIITIIIISRGTYLPDIDTSSLLSLCMPIPELGHDADRIQTSVLGQRGWDDLHGLGVCSEAVSLHAAQAVAVLGHAVRDLDLGCSSTGNQSPVGREKSWFTSRISWFLNKSR